MTTSTDPRVEFAHLSVEELRSELDGVTTLERKLQQELGRARPTCEEVEALIRPDEVNGPARFASCRRSARRDRRKPGGPGLPRR